MAIVKECLICKRKFKIYPYRKYTANYCSYKCRNLAYKDGRYKGKKANSYKHGFKQKDFRFYNTWRGIKNRCLNKNVINYNRYGGREIKICKSWLKFENFCDDTYKSYKEHIKKFGEKNTQIDRIDNNENYSKENCRWTTRKKQARNTNQNHWITFQGKTQCLTDWAEQYHLHPQTLKFRIKRSNWPIEKALTKSIKK